MPVAIFLVIFAVTLRVQFEHAATLSTSLLPISYSLPPTVQIIVSLAAPPLPAAGVIPQIL
jgi:hypothetical protein